MMRIQVICFGIIFVHLPGVWSHYPGVLVGSTAQTTKRIRLAIQRFFSQEGQHNQNLVIGVKGMQFFMVRLV